MIFRIRPCSPHTYKIFLKKLIGGVKFQKTQNSEFRRPPEVSEVQYQKKINCYATNFGSNFDLRPIPRSWPVAPKDLIAVWETSGTIGAEPLLKKK